MHRPASVGGGPFVPVIHGLRAAAVFVVVFFHLMAVQAWKPHPGGAFFQSSFLAVDALFFTTGFVLLLPVAMNGTLGSIKGFAIRRYTRIAAPYYVSLLVVVLTLPLLVPQHVVQWESRTGATGLTSYLVHLAFLQHEINQQFTGFLVNSPVWTLSVDFAFYCLFPFIAAAFIRRPVVGLVIGLAGAAAWRSAFLHLGLPVGQQVQGAWLTQFPLFFGDFASGMAAACLFVALRRRAWHLHHATRCTVLAAASLVALLGVAHIAGAQTPYYGATYQEAAWLAALFPIVLIVFVVAMALSSRRVQWPMANRVTQGFAEISYSVYLYHFPIIFFALYTLDIPIRHHSLLLAAAVVPACLATATLSYYFIELPSRMYGRRLAKWVEYRQRYGQAAVTPGSSVAAVDRVQP